MDKHLEDRRGLEGQWSIPSLGLIALALTIASPLASAVECDKSAAMNVTMMIIELAKVRTEGNHIAVHWTYAFEEQPRAKRLQMTRTYADTDACLTGVAREIHFYRKKKLVGVASPTTGIKLVD